MASPPVPIVDSDHDSDNSRETITRLDVLMHMDKMQISHYSGRTGAGSQSNQHRAHTKHRNTHPNHDVEDELQFKLEL